MKTISRQLPLLVCLAAIALGLTSQSVKAAPSVHQLFHRLKAMPVGTSSSRLSHVMVALTKRDPARGVKYFKVALDRLALNQPSAYADATKLAIGVMKEMKKAGLSSRKIRRVGEILSGHGFKPIGYTTDYPIPIPDVTSTPTPAP